MAALNVVLQPPRRTGLGVDLPPDPQAQYQHYQTPQGQTEIKQQAQANAVDFASSIAAWAGGGPKPNLPSQQAVGTMAAAAATFVPGIGPALAGAIMLSFTQAALERKVFDALGAPSWVFALGAAAGDVGSVINAAYGALTSVWGSQGCPTPGPPDCTKGPPPSGYSDPNWKWIAGDCDYVHAAWLQNDINFVEGGGADKSQGEIQFWYLYSVYLMVMWTSTINCKMPPPSDRDVLYAVMDAWNKTHAPTSVHTFSPVALDPGHDWFDPPHPSYLNWVLSGGPSGYNGTTQFNDGPITIATGALIPPGSHTIGPPIVAGQPALLGGQSKKSPPSSIASKVVKGAAVVAGSAVAASLIYAWVKKKSVGYVWGRAWERTKQAVKKL